MEEKTEESLRSSVNHENGGGSSSGCSTEAETEGTDRSFFFSVTSASVELTSQIFKCENLLTEAQAETEG